MGSFFLIFKAIFAIVYSTLTYKQHQYQIVPRAFFRFAFAKKNGILQSK